MLQFMGLQRVEHNLVTERQCVHVFGYVCMHVLSLEITISTRGVQLLVKNLCVIFQA